MGAQVLKHHQQAHGYRNLFDSTSPVICRHGLAWHEAALMRDKSDVRFWWGMISVCFSGGGG